MEADKFDDEWKLRKKILNASNRNQLCLKLAIWLFVMMSFVALIPIAVFHGHSHLYEFHPLGMVVLLPLISFSSSCIYTFCCVEELRLRTKLKNFICKLRSECQKSMSDKVTFQCEVYLKEIESILNAYYRRGFLDQEMQWCKLLKVFFKIQCIIIKSGGEIESIINPRELKEWCQATTNYNEIMQIKWFFKNLATSIHGAFCRKIKIAVN